MKGQRAQQGVQGVEIGLRIANVLAEAEGPMALSEIAKAAGMPASKAHRYLVSLCRSGLMEQDPASSRYDLSRSAIRMGLAALSRLDEFRAADAILQELHRATRIASYAMVWGGQGPVPVRRAESAPFIVAARIGATISTVNSSAGRVFAAYLPPHLTDPVITKEIASGVKPTVGGQTLKRAEFNKLLAQIREDGIGGTQDLVSGFQSLSAPVFDMSGQIVMTLLFLSLRDEHDFSPTGKTAGILKEAALNLSYGLGYSGVPARVF